MFETKDRPGQETAPLEPPRVKQLVEAVMRLRFPGIAARQRVKVYPHRVNFACPYCGDSAKDDSLKRGNIYLDSMHFKCFNCGKFTDALTLFREHGAEVPDQEALTMRVLSMEAAKNRQISKAERADMSAAMLGGTDFKEVLVSRDELMRAMGLWEIRPGSPQDVYLAKRRQTLDEKFAWDNRGRRLFIFNTDLSGQYVFGAQTREFSDKPGRSGAKYLTYGIRKIRVDWMKETPTEEQDALWTDINHLSTVFGILRVDFGRTVTIFEGPMDSFLMDNACATCSTNNEWPFDVGQRRYMQDNDEAGAKLAFRKIVEGESVFLWRRFIRENALRSGKFKDLNDLRIEEFVKDRRFDLERYFSADRRDMADIVGNDDTFGMVSKQTTETKWKRRNT